MAWDSENRLSYTREEYNQLWQFYQQLREENEQLKKREKNCIGIEQENKRLKDVIQYIFDEIKDEYDNKIVYICEEDLASVLNLISNIYNVVAQILK